MIRKILLLSSLLMSCTISAQSSGVGINSTGANPDPSSGLDVDFNDKGILIPRLTTIQRDAIQNAAVGLQLYNTTTNCLQIYMPLSGWRDVSCDCITPPSSAFTFPDSSAFNGNVIFNAFTSGMNYSWTFQSGTPSTSTQQSPSVVWANTGTYAVSLTVSDNIGCSTTTTDSITIVNCPSLSTLNFTNCTQIGNLGPTQSQCNSAYSGTPLANDVTVNGGIQEWTVPFTGIYKIEVAGAAGSHNGSGYGGGGRGAVLSGEIQLNQGQVLKVLVGQEGKHGTFAGGGGGGSFVVTANNTPLFVAGGGGSSRSGSTMNYNYTDATTSNCGANGTGGAGGCNGNGAGSSSNNGVGGAGFNTNGSAFTDTRPMCNKDISQSFLNGGVGGKLLYDCNNNPSSLVLGGFGGGSASGWGGAAGGGGYSGGGPGSNSENSGFGGGGGSYIDVSANNVSTSNGQYNGTGTFNGNAIINLNTQNSGQGYVTINLICP